MSRDPIVDEVRRVRDALVKKHGGLDGWLDHLQEMDRRKTRKPAESSSSLKPKRTKSSKPTGSATKA
jgi:hypothetical protein